jgi:hypothetical protein
VQAATSLAEIVGRVDAGDDEHRHRIRESLADRRRSIGHAGPGDQHAHAGPAGGARIAIGHEAGTLLVAHGDVTDLALGETAIEIERVHAGNTENSIDTIAFEQRDGGLTAIEVGLHRSIHDSHGEKGRNES